MDQKYKISGFHARIPAVPHQLSDRITPTEKSIVLCHLGVPEIAAGDWRLVIDGMVDRTATITLDELKQFPPTEIESVHQCAGSPLNPENPTQRVCNVIWRGARVADILSDCGVRPDARFMWSTGSDMGVFADIPCPAYVKDIPVERIREDVLVAYEMNRKALLPEHGYPARLLVPGYYGTNSVKWLRRLTLADTRPTTVFTVKWYNDPVYLADGSRSGATEPVWKVAPQSIIVSPSPKQKLPDKQETSVWGWAWADGGIDRVDLSVDAGQSWFAAALEKCTGRGWQRFTAKWKPPARGRFDLLSRATSLDGIAQPLRGRRNAIYSVEVEAV